MFKLAAQEGPLKGLDRIKQWNVMSDGGTKARGPVLGNKFWKMSLLLRGLKLPQEEVLFAARGSVAVGIRGARVVLASPAVFVESKTAGTFVLLPRVLFLLLLQRHSAKQRKLRLT